MTTGHGRARDLEERRGLHASREWERSTSGIRGSAPLAGDENEERLVDSTLECGLCLALGAIAQQVDYDEWGVVLQDTNPGWMPFGFAGGLSDSSLGLLRFGARDIDAVVGRFLAKDASRFRGGTAYLFEYALNDPLNVVDREGKAVAAVAPAAVIVIGTAVVITGILTSPEGQELVQDTARLIEDWWREIPPLLPVDPGVHEPTEPIEYQWPKSYPAAPGRRGPAPGPVCKPSEGDLPFPDVAPQEDPRQPPPPEDIWKSDDRRKLEKDIAGNVDDWIDLADDLANLPGL